MSNAAQRILESKGKLRAHPEEQITVLHRAVADPGLNLSSNELREVAMYIIRLKDMANTFV